jgi:hypothetical protein
LGEVECAAGLGVGKVRDAVGAHAPGEPQHRLLLRRGRLPRGRRGSLRLELSTRPRSALEPRRVDVDPGPGELSGIETDLSRAAGVGEVRHAVAAHARRVRLRIVRARVGSHWLCQSARRSRSTSRRRTPQQAARARPRRQVPAPEAAVRFRRQSPPLVVSVVRARVAISSPGQLTDACF